MAEWYRYEPNHRVPFIRLDRIGEEEADLRISASNRSPTRQIDDQLRSLREVEAYC